MKKKMVISAVSVFVLALATYLVLANTYFSPYETQLRLAYKYLDEGNYTEAILAFDKAIEIDAKKQKAYIGKAEVYIVRGDENAITDASAVLKEAVEQNGVDSDALSSELTVLLDKLVGLGLDDESFEFSNSAYEVLGNTKISEWRGKRRVAREVVRFEEKTASNPLDAQAYLDLADEYIRNEQPDEALKVLNDALEKTNNDAAIRKKIKEIESGKTNASLYRRVKETSYHPNGSVNLYTTYEYDANDNKTKETRYNSDGSVDSCETYEYDANDNKTKETYYYTSNSLFNYYETYEYDANGNRTKETRYNSDGSVDSYTTYEYDANDNKTKETRYNSDGSVDSYYIYEYDVNGNRTKETRYNSGGSVDYYETYEYDIDGNVIKKIYDYYNVEEAINGYTICEYDTNGKKTTETHYNSNDSIYGYTTYEYDADGNITKESSDYGEDADGPLLWYTTSEYDANGNRTKETHYDSDGLSYYIIVEYEKIA